ncbi:Poly [ADP-ribose] polymerase 2, partial [Nowakowskiella sp. JEL0078]
ATRDGASILTKNPDFRRYIGSHFTLYDDFCIALKYKKLHLCKWSKSRKPVPKDRVLTNFYPKAHLYTSSSNFSPTSYIQGSPSPLTKILGNPYLQVRELRQALYARLDFESVTERLPYFDPETGIVVWEETVVNSDPALEHLLSRPIKAVAHFFPPSKLKKPENVSIEDWDHHLFAVHAITMEVCAASCKVSWKEKKSLFDYLMIKEEQYKIDFEPVNQKLSYMVASDNDFDKRLSTIKKCLERDDISIVSSDFINQCISQKKILDASGFAVTGSTLSVDSTAVDPDEVKTNSTEIVTRKRKSKEETATTSKKQKEGSEDLVTEVKSETTRRTSKRNVKRKTGNQEEKEDESESKGKGKKVKEEEAEQKVKQEEKPAKEKGKQKKEIPEADSTPNIVTKIKKGKAVVDEWFPYAKDCHVYDSGDVVYDCMLNQTEIGHNNNKFYKIQVLRSDSVASKFYSFNRWGRVGAKGMTSLLQFSTAEGAIHSFSQKFKDKTKNDWENRQNFVKYPGKYHYIEMDYGDEDEAPEDSAEVETDREIKGQKAPETKLDVKVQDIMKLIFNVEEMKREMVEIGYDVLNQISAILITRPANLRSELQRLSSEFYTLIPHDFGRNVPPTIDTMETLKKKVGMVEALADMRIASKLIQSMKGNFEKNVLDLHYDSLKCELKPLDHNDERFDVVKKYTKNTHAATHNQYTLDVLDVFDLSREGENDVFEKGKGGQIKENRQLLWHGSRITNFAGIMSQGLRIAPPEAPVTGYMFGKGVYFANMVSKSANYCFTNSQNNIGLLLLCEVALGAEKELLHADYNAGELAKKSNKDSTKGIGSTCPDPEQSIELDGATVPLGTPIKGEKASGSLLYDEFIVYDVSQIKM